MSPLLYYIVILGFIGSVWINIAQGVECNKFSDRDGRSMPVYINNICYYPFSTPYTQPNAKTICESEATRLPVVDSSQKQELLTGMVGFIAPEYWTGLEYIDGTWYWIDGANKYVMVEPRWTDFIPEIPLYAHTRENSWVKAGVFDTKPFICEDDHSRPTVEKASPYRMFYCTFYAYTFGITYLKSVINVSSVISCASVCLETNACYYIHYKETEGLCKMAATGGRDYIVDAFYCPRY